MATLGGLLGAVAASSCCIVPLALFDLGLGGAWIGHLTALAPYQPVVVALALGFLGAGFWMVYRGPRPAGAAGRNCIRPVSRRIMKCVLWISTALVIAAMAFPYVAPLVLNV